MIERGSCICDSSKSVKTSSVYVEDDRHIINTAVVVPSIKKEFCFNENKDEIDALKKILHDNCDVFSKHKYDIGLAKNAYHTIDTYDDVPICVRPYRVPFAIEDKVDEVIQKLIEHDIIEKCKSPWNSPLIAVKKKMETSEYVFISEN